MGKTKNQLLGREAEDNARTHFQDMGFEVVARNYRFGRGEIDLIVEKNALLVFVEVKYRSNKDYGNPEEFVTDAQKKLIIETADHFIHQNNWQKNIRFDIIAIDDEKRLEHFEDAFY